MNAEEIRKDRDAAILKMEEIKVGEDLASSAASALQALLVSVATQMAFSGEIAAQLAEMNVKLDKMNLELTVLNEPVVEKQG